MVLIFRENVRYLLHKIDYSNRTKEMATANVEVLSNLDLQMSSSAVILFVSNIAFFVENN